MAEPLFISADIPLVKPTQRLVINAILQFLCIALTCVLAGLPEWFSYCEFKWSLYLSKTDKSMKSRIDGSLISDVHEGLCGEFSPVINGVCKDFCGNARLLEVAGIVGLACLAVCFVMSVMYFVLDFVLLARGFLKSKLLYVR